MDDVITTSDIYLVSALLSRGFELMLPVNASDPRHFKFTVMGNGIEEIRREWNSGILDGNLIEFSRCLKNMKALIHESCG